MILFAVACSILEITALYLSLLLIDPGNKISWTKFSITAAILTSLTFVIEALNLLSNTLFTMIFLWLAFFIINRTRARTLLPDLALGTAICLIFHLSMTIVINIFNPRLATSPLVHIPILSLLVALIIILIKFQRLEHLFDFHRKNRWLTFFGLCNLILVGIMIANVWKSSESLFFKEKTLITALIPLLLFTAFFTIKSIYSAKMRKRNTKIISDYSEYQKKMIYELKTKEHEFHRHLNALGLLADGIEDPKLRGEIQGYIASYISGGKIISEIGHDTIISPLLLYYKDLCQCTGIKWNCNIIAPISHYKITSYELVELLTNLLENAIEAINVLDGHSVAKEITVSFDGDLIQISNPIGTNPLPHSIAEYSTAGFTTKKSGRGFGLSVVQKIVRDNDILIESEVQNDIYVVTLEMPSV